MNNLDNNVNKQRESGLSSNWEPLEEAKNLARDRRISVSGCAAKFRVWARGRAIDNPDDRFLMWVMNERQPPADDTDADHSDRYEPTLKDFENSARLFARNNS